MRKGEGIRCSLVRPAAICSSRRAGPRLPVLRWHLRAPTPSSHACFSYPRFLQAVGGTKPFCGRKSRLGPREVEALALRQEILSELSQRGRAAASTGGAA